ncbi:type II toxin-antitoxin system HipA family toxin [Novosphingobium sp. JCM 18896]|uniref:type II toxin-antitoxin system HipA family toxin n=1 Tax=Novosphingobium sp. JCM 18896 TaxID=2989731 RepID=UPI002222B74B|nr:type II toxin-antitoxin system HipA family toxin [Novosphingobium sp. JCM 18896]MCW1431632.1 type II toxin-antitoxin system HipA family toxin [Novosphingobium sp. JCM 18896]
MLVLDVWIEAAPSPIGHLVRDNAMNLAFAYTQDWLKNANNHPLSLSLPLRDEPYDDVPVRAYFDNLLQENSQLESLMAREGLQRGDIAGLLEHLGADCAGAVSVLRTDHPPVKRPGNVREDYDPIDEATFTEIVTRLATGRPLREEMRDPSPVAGVRPKISLAALPDGRFGFPKPGSGAPTTHILKLPDPDHRHEARDEAFLTLLAARCGFQVGSSIADTVEGHDVLLIERFDRIIDGDFIYRRHQEDFAQAAGLPAELKYERRGRPGRRFDATTIGRILAATNRPAIARETFMRITLFNLLVGNNDNHAKNHTLFHDPGNSVELAPFYDLVPVQTVAGFKEDLAFRLGKAELPEQVGAADLLQFCEKIGLPAKGARRLLANAARDLLEHLEALSPDFPKEMGALDRLLGETSDHLNTALELGLNIRQRDAHVVKGGGWALS